MDLVFSTDDVAPARRYAAWREAICDVYVHVDVKATHPEDYKGFIREARFGEVVLTDILLSEQRIRRNKRHIAQLDKDCYYLQLIHHGHLNVIQRGATHFSNAARGAIFSATEQYELQCLGEVRSFYLEIPRDEFARRFPRERVPVSATINSTRGLGRIASEFCSSLATEGATLAEDARAHRHQLMDMTAFPSLAEGDVPGGGLAAAGTSDRSCNGSTHRRSRLSPKDRRRERHVVALPSSSSNTARCRHLSGYGTGACSAATTRS
jgi:hypothetical protein